jgi:hypothetical protein
MVDRQANSAETWGALKTSPKEADTVSEESEIEDDVELYEIAYGYLLQAMNTIQAKKVDDMLTDWLKGHLSDEPGEDLIGMITAVALDACLFAPSLSGSTPMSRFLSSVKTDDPRSRQALQALSRSEIRQVRIRNRIEPDLIILKDMISNERLTLVDSDFVEESEGFDALLRLCRLDSGRYIMISFPFMLTEESFGIIDGFYRPGKGIINPYRCACAVYKHAVREGLVAIPQREPTEEEIEEAAAAEIVGVSSLIDEEWEAAKSDPEKYATFVEELRRASDVDGILSYLQIYSLALSDLIDVSPDNARDICTVMIEELARRQRDGEVEAEDGVDGLRRKVEEGVEQGTLNAECKTFFENVLAETSRKRT